MKLSVRPPSARPAYPPSRTRGAAALSQGRAACCRSPPSPPGPTGCPPCRRPASSSARPTGTSRGSGRASPARPPEARQEALGPRVVARHASAGGTRTYPGGRRPWRTFPRPRPPGPTRAPRRSAGPGRSATSQNSSPRSLAPQTTHTSRFDMPRSRTAPPQRCGSRGIPAADLGRLPAGDSPGRVPSTWQETAVPSRTAQGRGPRPRRASFA